MPNIERELRGYLIPSEQQDLDRVLSRVPEHYREAHIATILSRAVRSELEWIQREALV